MSDARIVEEFYLPSQGLIYEGIEVDPSGMISSMKAKHEMLRLSVTDGSHKIMAEILDDCLESDLGISAYDLCLGDYQYLLFKLRVVTFGNEYTLRGKCPFCGFEQSTTVDLDALETKEYTNAPSRTYADFVNAWNLQRGDQVTFVTVQKLGGKYEVASALMVVLF